MWIKNLTVFSAKDPFTWPVSELEAQLENARCQPCGSQSPSSEGFVPPLKGEERMVFAVEGFVYCVHQEITRLLPGPVIKEELDERVEQIQERDDRRVGRKERAELKEQITFELLPRAFTRSRRTGVLIDLERGRILVDSSSSTRAEQVVSALREALGSLPVTHAGGESAPTTAFAGWLRDHRQLPEDFGLGDRCELKDVKGEGASVRFTAVDLGREEILAHLDTDMVPVRVNLSWNDQLEFDLTDGLDLKRIKALDQFQENLDGMEADDAVAELMARISLQGNALRNLLDGIYQYFQVKADAA
ncbi:recombination-associated protein RdgC [Alloalcanivorax xenomutans]|jgi:recombination associated protein RdgC|uniref:Recombination-associated protein RdgC n=1 Tax=Alloalcanivorax xenomutans TaxID=1094342 RepID=A0A9Q3ZCV1_9GAMM|nr:recombination-associated protein RdgC [Alloalcanivorax xenomutans]KYZ84614.1 recombinase [Alcanivorax sp. KX64203]MBA4720898.1 recombination-associated protein RdgC [Alcanivorax sp.]ARB44337.1 recombinase [Alloalcanivorax xenomutans]MCE7508770.1 recombination-associated protein RdgC [Alloalcanivorax xenomutans]MCE7524325.1 recombination-associated protein RdgC [Alloalcanivorax xenomutans]|tara:strand:- start:1743 stop:2654 length:912 start_codon:yes stop_codon:yes gene_type:complete